MDTYMEWIYRMMLLKERRQFQLKFLPKMHQYFSIANAMALYSSEKEFRFMLCLRKCSNEIASTSARILGIINSIFISFYFFTPWLRFISSILFFEVFLVLKLWQLSKGYLHSYLHTITYLHKNISHFNKFLIGQIDKILTIISKYFFYTQIITRKVFVRRFPIYSLP